MNILNKTRENYGYGLSLGIAKSEMNLDYMFYTHDCSFDFAGSLIISSYPTGCSSVFSSFRFASEKHNWKHEKDDE